MQNSIRIVRDLRGFFRRINCTARTLALVSGVSPYIISRLINGVQSDTTSDNADRLRTAMRMLTKEAKCLRAREY